MNIKTVRLGLLFLIIIILILAGLSIASYQYRSILQEQKNALEKEHKEIHTLYQTTLDHLKQELITYSKLSLSSKDVVKAMYIQDKTKLEELTALFFKFYQEQNPYLKVMTFRLKDGKTLLRLHQPDMFGDSVHPSRHSILTINKEHTFQSGFEIGKLKMAYRIITPIFYHKEYIGSLELGVEPDYILDVLKQRYPLQYALLVKPSSTTAALDLKVLDKIEDFYLLQSDPIFIDNAQKIILNKTQKDLRLRHQNSLFSISEDRDIFNASKSVIAKILIAKDITKMLTKTDELIKNSFIFTVILILLLGSLLHIGLNFFIKKIEHTQKQLEVFNESLEAEVLKQTKEQSLLLSLFDFGDSVLFKWKNDEYWSIESVSESVQRLMGYDKSSFLSQEINYASCIHPEYIQTVSEEVTQALESNSDFFTHKPYRILTKDGHIKWLHDNTTLVKDEKGKVTHFVGVISDISEIKQKEQQLMDQSRLAQMGEMISMIAHQWRQPLATISATTIALKVKIDLEKYDLNKKEERALCQEDFKCQLDNIEDLTQTLTSTITDFRNFYQPNKNYSRMSIHEPLSKALNIIKGSLINNKITYVQELTDTVKLDLLENEIMQVILNIFKNSQDNFQIKDIKDRKIWLRTYDVEDGVELNICDNGGGIDESVIDKVFDPYFSTKHDKNGTGLGLYMSKTIIEEHHKGELRVVNKDDGVCFYISLHNRTAQTNDE